MNKEAKEAVVKARTRLIVRHRFYGCLALNLIAGESTAASTTATEGKHFFYNPDYILGLDEDERVGAWAQCVTHCVYKHIVRRQWRDPRKWNMACDYVINLDLLTAGFTLPPGALVDAKFLGMSAEEAYENIPDEEKSQGGGQGGDEPGGDQGQGQQPSPGQQPGQRNDQQEHDPGNCGEVLDAVPDEGETVKDVEHDWEQNARQAIAIAKAANAGNIPGDIERLVKMLDEPRIDWREMTRQWIDQSVSKVDSWSHPNRRYLPYNLILPGPVTDRLHHLVFVIDTSGSITGRLLSEMGTEIKAALEEGTADMLSVIYTDTKFQGYQEFEDGDELHLKPKGGGGTAFAAVFKWIEENVADASAIVFFTDLQVSRFGEAPDCPLLWAVHGPKQSFPKLAAQVPFGEALHVDYA
jgi:predicted metal-dependent peptidase